MIEVTSFGGQNWLITPGRARVNEPAPANISGQLLVLSSVGIANMKGKTSDDWLHDEVRSTRTCTGRWTTYAIRRSSIPRPQGTEGAHYNAVFNLELWSPFAGLSSVFDQDRSVNAGSAVDAWRPAPSPDGSFAAPAEVM